MMNGSNSQECTENIFPGWVNSYSQQFLSVNAFAMSAASAMTRANNVSNKDSAHVNFLPCSCHVFFFKTMAVQQRLKNPGAFSHQERECWVNNRLYDQEDYWGRQVCP